MAEFRTLVANVGGDTQALNATLDGIVEAAEEKGGEVIGSRRGFLGILYPKPKSYFTKKYGETETRLLLDTTGEYVILKRSDINPGEGGSKILLSTKARFQDIQGAEEDIPRRLKDLGIDYLVLIGGDGTTSMLAGLAEKLKPVKVIVVSKTIDNDFGKIGPENKFEDFNKMTNIWTPGYPTAVANGVSYSHRVISNIVTHEKIFWKETFGNLGGWIALGVASHVPHDMVIIPEVPVNLNEVDQRVLEIYLRQGFFYGLAAEGAIDVSTGKPISETNGKLGGVAAVLAQRAKEYFDKNKRHAPYIDTEAPKYSTYRGGSPTKLDMKYGRELGYGAMMALIKDEFNGRVPAAVLLWNGKKSVASVIPLEEAVELDKQKHLVSPRFVPIQGIGTKGFYDPERQEVTELGKQYFGMLKIPKVEFKPWKGEIHT